jgi:hypothetical protein
VHSTGIDKNYSTISVAGIGLSTQTNFRSGAIQGMWEDLTEVGDLCGCPAPVLAGPIQYVFQMSNRVIRAMCDEVFAGFW